MGLRDVRLKKGLTQVALAKLCGIEQTHISQLERADDPNVGWHTLRRLIAALKARPEDLFALYPPRDGGRR